MEGLFSVEPDREYEGIPKFFTKLKLSSIKEISGIITTVTP
jgi:hypothetical protein